ncbi:MAG TPA: hypothetical protein VM734_23065 [Kofleriaceae bacterium]|nr:hypothetical protein [Kofleriaceae bacterium]
MTISATRYRAPGPAVLVLAIVAAVGCSGDGCSCLGAIPGGFPAAERAPNAAQIRVSQTGLAALTADPAALVSGLLGGPLQFDVPASCGGSPAVCCVNGQPVSPCGPIVIDLTQMPGDQPRLELRPAQGASRLDVRVRARVRTAADVPVNVPIVGDCVLRIDTTGGTPDDITVDVPVTFAQDATAGTTRLDVGTVALTNLSTDDVDLTGSLACDLANLGLGLFLNTLTTTFQDAVRGAISDQACKACPSGQVAECGAFATACTDNVCMNGNACLQELGVTGRMPASAVFGGFSPGTTGALDLYEVLGGYATSDNNGLALGMLGGMLPAGTLRDRCGPPATAPARPTIPRSTFFQGNTRPDTGAPFDIAIGVHEHQLDQFAYAAYDGGVLCLTITQETVDLLTSDTFGLFLPSLSNLTGGSRPMAIGLRPQSPPTIVLGRNTFVSDGGGGMTVDEPLLDLSFQGLELDFYAMIEDQYVRLFTVVADLHLPIGLEVGTMGDLTPVLGNIEGAFTNVTVKNAEPMVETAEQLSAIFPMLLDLALPQLVGSLGAFQVPTVGGLQVDVTSITAVDNAAFLAIFGELSPAAMMAAPRVETSADVTGQYIPGTEVFDDSTSWARARRPSVELALGGCEAQPDSSDPTSCARRGERDLEWSTRVDGGLWSAWSATAQRTITSPRFWLQGKHVVEVRARRRGQPRSADPTPVAIPVLIDTLPPEPKLEVADGVVRIGGHDAVSGEALTVRWRLGGSAWQTAAAPVDVALAGADPKDLIVEVIDEAGNLAPTRGSTAIARADFHGAPGESGCSCGAGGDPRGTGLLALLVAAVLALRKRSRKLLRSLMVLAIGAVLPACSCGGSAPCGDKECEPGEVAMGIIGTHNAAASDGTRTVVTTYDQILGDVVLVEVGSGEPTYHVVDGIPDETPTFDPGTYRGGIPTPGPDVGRYTTVALTGGLARIAYQDRDRKALRYAAETRRHAFSAHDVDVPDDPGVELGAYASIAVTGAPAIAYTAVGVPGAGDELVTELRLARAGSASPNDPGDWTITTIASAPTSCAGRCGDLTCVAPVMAGEPETCVAPTTDCTATCDGDTQACVAGACRDVIGSPKVQTPPRGTGLYANLLALADGRLVVVHYDSARTALIGHVESAAGAGTFTETILDGDGDPDRGMWASAVVDAGGVVHVAYQDAQGDQVFYLTWTPGSAAGTPELVDDGVRAGDRTHPVGAGATIWLASGEPVIAYQDGISSDLVLARKSGGAWSHADHATGALLDGFHIAAPAQGGVLIWDQLDKLRSPPHGLSIQRP